MNSLIPLQFHRPFRSRPFSARIPVMCLHAAVRVVARRPGDHRVQYDRALATGVLPGLLLLHDAV